MIWREKRILLIVLGVILAANTIFFFTYRIRYEQRLNDLDQRKSESLQQLEGARVARLLTERQVAGYRKVQQDIDQVYNERWSTQAQRLLPLILEVKRLAAACRLIPPTTSYTQSVSKTTEVGAMNTTVVGISFAVQGSYERVRRLINLLELSPQFVIIDSIALTPGGDQSLNLNLRVKTLFRDVATAQQRAANSQL